VERLKAGKAGALFETGPIRDASKTETAKARVSEKFPMVSAVAMIAPSPDWFAGVANVNLKEGGKWVATKTVELRPWDSGDDDGATYKAPDKDNNPQEEHDKGDEPSLRDEREEPGRRDVDFHPGEVGGRLAASRASGRAARRQDAPPPARAASEPHRARRLPPS
jgi:Spondin_N